MKKLFSKRQTPSFQKTGKMGLMSLFGRLLAAGKERYYQVPSKRRHFVLLSGATGLLCLWLLSGFLHPEVNDNLLSLDTTSPVQVLLLEKGSISQKVEVGSILEGEKTVNFFSAQGGTVKQILVQKGKWVQKGQPLIEMESSGQESNFRAAKANYEASLQLYHENLVSQVDFQKSKAAFEQARQAYKNSTFRAPFDGVLDNVIVKANDTVQPGSKIATFSSLDSLKIHLDVSERYAGLIKKGTKATITLLNDETAGGYIRWVSRTVDSSTHTISLEVIPQGYSKDWVPGLSATVQIQTPKKEAYLIPFGAMVLDKNKKPCFKFLDKDYRVFETPVKIFEKEEEGVWIRNIPKGAKYVVVLGAGSVQEGQRLKNIFIRQNLKKPDKNVFSDSAKAEHATPVK